jgi:hypothetical protein
MIFCGQCGLQLAAGTMNCPRCGTPVEDAGGNREVLHVNDPTIVSSSFSGTPQAGPAMPSTPPPLVLRPGNQGGDYNPQDATSMMDASMARNPALSAPGQTAYMGGGAYQPNTMPPTGVHIPPYPAQGTQMAYPLEQGSSSGNPTLRVAGMITIVFGLLLILSSIVLFVVQHNG